MATTVAALVMITGVAQAGHRPDETLHVCESPGGALQVGEECRRGGTAHALVTEGGLGAVEGRLEALESENTALTGTVDTLQSDLATAEGDVAQLQETVKTIEEDLAEVVADNCGITDNGNGTARVTCGDDSVTLRIPTAVTVDSTGDGGRHTSIAIGADGNPVLSYSNNGVLKVAACTDPACGNADLSPIDTGLTSHVSIAIGADGNPVISYQAGLNLHVAACTNPKCSNNTRVTTLDSLGVRSRLRGLDTSIAIGADGNPVISYNDASNRALKVAACADRACTDATLTTVDRGGDPEWNLGSDSSIAIGADGNPVISYHDGANGTLKVAACIDRACTDAELTTIEDDLITGAGRSTSIAIGADGNPVISYSYRDSNSVRVAACTDPACTDAELTRGEIGGGGESPAHTSIAIGADGNPVISYDGSITGSDDLAVATCNDPTCAVAEAVDRKFVDSAVSAGYFSSIAIGIDGNPVVSYLDATNDELKVARLFN